MSSYRAIYERVMNQFGKESRLYPYLVLTLDTIPGKYVIRRLSNLAFAGESATEYLSHGGVITTCPGQGSPYNRLGTVFGRAAEQGFHDVVNECVRESLIAIDLCSRHARINTVNIDATCRPHMFVKGSRKEDVYY